MSKCQHINILYTELYTLTFKKKRIKLTFRKKKLLSLQLKVEKKVVA